MCLIIHRPASLTLPQDWIDNSLINNPDGWGIMASDGVRLRIKRGMSRGRFASALKRFKNHEVFIHFRNATHGTIGIENCHPFTIVNDQFAVMHNGVINLDASLCEDRSDTWHYANRFLAPILEQAPTALTTTVFAETIGKHVGAGNKLVILGADGVHSIINREQGVERNGCWLSNAYSIQSPWVKRSSGSECSLDELAWLERDELIELCMNDPESVADAILDDRWSYALRRDYR